MKRESMVFYLSFHDALADLPGDLYKEVCVAVMDYAMKGIEPELNGIARTVFKLIRPQVDANNRRYDAKVARRKRALGTEDPTEAREASTETPPEIPLEHPPATFPEAPEAPPGAPVEHPPATSPEAPEAPPGVPVEHPPGTPVRFAPEKRPVDVLWTEFSAHEGWLETVAMKNGITAARAREWLKAFALHLVASGREEETDQEFKRYFANWCASEIRQGRQPVNAPPPGTGADEKLPPGQAMARAMAAREEAPPPPPPGMDALRARVARARRREEEREAGLGWDAPPPIGHLASPEHALMPPGAQYVGQAIGQAMASGW